MFWHVTSSRSQLGNTGERKKDWHWSEDTKTHPDFSSTSILRQVIAYVRSLTGRKSGHFKKYSDRPSDQTFTKSKNFPKKRARASLDTLSKKICSCPFFKFLLFVKVWSLGRSTFQDLSMSISMKFRVKTGFNG